MARLARRQGQLERQQRDTNRRVEVLRRDADSGIENLRWNTDFRLMDLERKVASLDRFRDFIESRIMYAIMIGCAVALVISMVVIVVEARGARQETHSPRSGHPIQ